jgi:TatD DNase family protein
VRLVDSHAHLQADPFAADLPAVLAAAALAGVERLLVPGWDLASSQGAVRLARDGAALYGARGGSSRVPLSVDAAVGIHPHAAASVDEATWEAIRALAADPAVLAIGETGLDYDRAFSPREAQLANLRRHLALGRATGKPVILHCRSAVGRRDAQDQLLAELREAGVGDAPWTRALDGRPAAILHSFSGPVDYAEAALELGLAISFSGLVFRRGEEASANVAQIVPADRLLTETDAPYLPPPGAPRRRNEPAWVRVTGAWIAERRAEDPDAVGAGLVVAYDAVFSGTTGGTLA